MGSSGLGTRWVGGSGLSTRWIEVWVPGGCWWSGYQVDRGLGTRWVLVVWVPPGVGGSGLGTRWVGVKDLGLGTRWGVRDLGLGTRCDMFLCCVLVLIFDDLTYPCNIE